MSLVRTFKNLTLYAAIVLIILGLVLPVAYQPQPPSELIMIIFGLACGVCSLTLSIISISKDIDESGVDDMIFHNSLTYIVIDGSIFLITAMIQPANANVEALLFDVGLIVGLFVILMYLWIGLRSKVDFLDIDLDIDFTSEADKKSIPQFLLTSLLLGGLFAVLYVLFKSIYYVVGFDYTAWSFIIVLSIFVFTISLVLFYITRMQKKK